MATNDSRIERITNDVLASLTSQRSARQFSSIDSSGGDDDYATRNAREPQWKVVEAVQYRTLDRNLWV